MTGPQPNGAGRPIAWTRREVITLLRAEAEKRHGLMPTLRQLVKLGGPSHCVIVRLFGSYKLAAHAAGLPPNLRGGQWKRKTIDLVRAEQITAEKRKFWEQSA